MTTSYESRLGTAPEEGVKAPCAVASLSDITLSGEQTISTVAVTSGDRVLVAGQTDSTENGIYVVSTGTWSRSSDCNDAQDLLPGVIIPISGPSISIYLAQFTGDYDPGVTSLTFTAVPALPGNEGRGTDIVSATTITPPEGDRYFVITGSTTITGISETWPGRIVVFEFAGSLQLTDSATLILPGGVDITTSAGDTATFVNESSNIWRLTGWISGSYPGLTQGDVDNTPVTGATTAPISSDWAYELDNIVATHINVTAAHGTTGDVVGTSDTQTLSNKTIAASSNTLTVASTDLSDSTSVLRSSDFGSTVQSYDAANGAFGSKLLHVQDQKTSGTDGGSSSVGANTRVLNAVVTNEIGGSPLASNQITLPAGTYHLEASAPAYTTNRHQLRIYDTTGAQFLTEVDGTAEFAATAASYGGSCRSFCTGRFTLSVESVLEVRHVIEKAVVTYGLGVASGTLLTVDLETYTDVKIWKIA